MTKSIGLRLLTLVLALILVVLLTTQRAGSGEGSAIAADRELIRGGFSLENREAVAGDFYATGNRVSSLGEVQGDQILLARQADVSGNTGDDLRLAVGTAEITGEVDGNVSLLGGSVTVGRPAVLNGSLLCAAGFVDLEGTVNGPVRICGGTVTLGGDMTGDVTVTAGRVILKPGARIQGEFIYSAPAEAVFSEGAITGSVRYLPPPLWTQLAGLIQYGLGGIGFPIIRGIFGFLALLVTGVFFLKCFPVFSGAAAGHLSAAPRRAACLGGILLILWPLAAILAMATVIGLPLGIILWAGLLVLCLVSRVTVSLWLGQALTRGWDENRAVPFIIGAVIISVLTALPFVGLAAEFLGLAAGFGGIITAYRNGVHLPLARKRTRAA